MQSRQTPLLGELSKVIPLGQLLPCHSPWEELVLHRGDVCGQQCFRLPPLLSIPVPSGRASSANAGPCTVRARFSMASSASLRYAGTAVQDVKRTNGGAIERADILLLQTGRIAPSRTPRVLRPKNLADATTDKAKHQCSVQLFIRWLSSLPPNCNS